MLSEHSVPEPRVADYDVLADEVRVDAGLVRVQSSFPYDSWRTAELRDLVGLVLGVPARHAAHE